MGVCCEIPTVEEFFEGVPPQFLQQAIEVFLSLFPPGTTVEEAIASIYEQNGCPGDGDDPPDPDDPGGSDGFGDLPNSLSARAIIPFDTCASPKTARSRVILKSQFLGVFMGTYRLSRLPVN